MVSRNCFLAITFLLPSLVFAQFATLEEGVQLSQETGRPIFVMAGRKT